MVRNVCGLMTNKALEQQKKKNSEFSEVLKQSLKGNIFEKIFDEFMEFFVVH